MGIRMMGFMVSLIVASNVFAAKKSAPKKTVSQKPVAESVKLKSERQKLEAETSEKMNQKLERARIEEEKKRQQELFVDGQLNNAPVQSAYVPTSASTVKTTADLEKSVLNEENNYYVAGVLGLLNYPTAANVRDANGAAGVQAGIALPYNLWIEAGFLYSFQEISGNEANDITDVDQYSITAVPSYHWNIADFWMTPIFGMAMAFTHRSYNADTNKSNAFEMGPMVGLDMALNRSVSLGLDYRYMINVSYDSDVVISNTRTLRQTNAGTTVLNKPLEELNYQMIMLNTKITF